MAANIDMVSLRAFLTVVDTESIRAASDTMNLSVSAVSRRVSELEQAFDQKLFERHSRGVVTTEAGRVLAGRVREIFSILDLTQIDMRALKLGDIGRVAVCANGSAF